MKTLMDKLLIFISLIFIILLVTGCESDEKITMIVPYGSTKLATLYLEDSTDYDVTIVDGPDPLVAAFGSKSYDAIVAPINLGAKLYDANPAYQLAAVVTWGNYYFVSETEVTLSRIESDGVVAFGENQTSDAMMQYVFDENNLGVDITYLDSVTSINAAFQLDPSKIYLTAEPVLSLMVSMHQAETLSLQALYEDLTGNEGFPQAGVFLSSDLEPYDVSKIQTDLENSIALVNGSMSLSASLAIELGFDMPQAVIEGAIENSNIVFKTGIDAKDEVISYLTLLLNFNPSFIGENLPDDTFYL